MLTFEKVLEVFQAYPADRRERIWTLGHFVTYVKEVENL